MTNIKQTVEANLLAGIKQCAIHYPESKRSEFIAAIAELRDALPIVAGWVTLRKSYLSETRTRARSYHIPEALLKTGDSL